MRYIPIDKMLLRDYFCCFLTLTLREIFASERMLKRIMDRGCRFGVHSVKFVFSQASDQGGHAVCRARPFLSRFRLSGAPRKTSCRMKISRDMLASAELQFYESGIPSLLRRNGANIKRGC